MAPATAASPAAAAFSCRAAGLFTPCAFSGQSHKPLWCRGALAECSFRHGQSICATEHLLLARNQSHYLWRQPFLVTKCYPCSLRGRLSVRCFHKSGGNLLKDVADYPQTSHPDLLLSSDGGAEMAGQEGTSDVLQTHAWRFQNRFLVFSRLGSVINDVAESFFKSEIRRRLFVTAVLILVSRVGYFIPLPGFDRRLIPEDYLTFVSGSMGNEDL